MFSYRIALGCLFVLACTARSADETSAGESEVRAESCKALATFEGTAEDGLRADLRAALGQPANDDAASLPGVLRVRPENGQDVVTLFQSSWGFEDGAFSFPSETFDHVASRALYDAMGKAKETFENDGEIVVRSSPKGRVVCRLFVGLNDPDESEYICTIPGLQGKAPSAKDCRDTVTFEAQGPSGLRAELRAATTSDEVAGAIAIDDSDIVQLFGTTWRYGTDIRHRPTMVFPAETRDSDASAKRLFDAMKNAPETKDGNDVMRTSADGLLQCGRYQDSAKSSYLCEVRRWPGGE